MNNENFLFFVFALGELDPTPWRPHPDGRSIHVRVRPAVQHCQDASVRGLDAADQIHASQRRRTVRMSDIHPAAPQPIHSIECRRLVSVFCQSSLVAVCLPSGRFPRSFDSRRYTRRLKDADDALFLLLLPLFRIGPLLPIRLFHANFVGSSRRYSFNTATYNIYL